MSDNTTDDGKTKELKIPEEAKKKLTGFILESILAFIWMLKAAWTYLAPAPNPLAKNKLPTWDYRAGAQLGAAVIGTAIPAAIALGLQGVPYSAPFEVAGQMFKRYWSEGEFLRLGAYIGYPALTALVLYVMCDLLVKRLPPLETRTRTETDALKQQSERLLNFGIMCVVATSVVVSIFYGTAHLLMFEPAARKLVKEGINGAGWWTLAVVYLPPFVLGFVYYRWLRRTDVRADVPLKGYGLTFGAIPFIAVLMCTDMVSRYAGSQQFLPYVLQDAAYGKPIHTLEQTCERRQGLIACFFAFYPGDRQSFQVFGNWKLAAFDPKSGKINELAIAWRPKVQEGAIPAVAFTEKKPLFLELSASEAEVCSTSAPTFQGNAKYFYADGQGIDDAHRYQTRRFRFDLNSEESLYKRIAELCRKSI